MTCQATVPDSFLLKGPCPRTGEFQSPIDGKKVCGLHYPLHSDPEREQEWMKQVSYGARVEDWIFAQAQQPDRGRARCLDLRGTIVRADVEFGKCMQRRGWSDCELLDATQAHFLGVTSLVDGIYDNVVLDKAIFIRHAFLSSLRCRNYFFFNEAQFDGPISCENSNFERDFTGDGAKLRAGVHFDNVSFGHFHLSNAEVIGNALFMRCRFGGFTSFSKVSFKSLAAVHGLPIPYQPMVIDVSFSYCEFQGATSFRSADFQTNTTFSVSKFVLSCDFQDAIFKYCPRMEALRFEQTVMMDGIRIGLGNSKTFRFLKNLMEAQGQAWLATRFYGDELRQDLSDTPWKHMWKLDPLLNLFYLGISNYGRNWLQPFIWIIVVNLTWWLFFFWTGAFTVRAEAELEGWLVGLDTWPLWQRSLVFAVQNIKPLWLVGSPVMVVTTWWAQTVVVVQSIANIFFVAMGILAMRKRFRI